MIPSIFIGHGSPMNALEENEFTRGWKEIAESFQKPEAILSVSAHWYTGSTGICTLEHPKTIYDFYGFPPALYQLEYPAPGAPDIARQAVALLHGKASEDNSWGLDHGTWSVLRSMYPQADVPVFQVSINRNLPPAEHFALGRALRILRDQNVLILGSGNAVHNLSLVEWDMPGGFPWAYEFDGYIQKALESRLVDDVIHFKNAGESAKYAFYTPEHFYPLLYALGAADDVYTVQAYNQACTMGSLSMTSYVFR